MFNRRVRLGQAALADYLAVHYGELLQVVRWRRPDWAGVALDASRRDWSRYAGYGIVAILACRRATALTAARDDNDRIS